MIINKSKERWEIRKTRQESLPSLKLDDREFVIFRTCLKKYQKDLEIVFITKKKFDKLSSRKQDYLKWKFEEDRNKMDWFKYMWHELRKSKEYTCSKCNTRTKYLYMFCKNMKHIKDFRLPDYELYCKTCWNELNAPVNIDSKAHSI